MKSKVFLLGFVLLVTGLRAQDFLAPGSAEYRVLDAIHRFDYKEARRIMETEKARISPAEYHFLQVNYFWWLWISAQKVPGYRDSLILHMNRVDKLTEGRTKESAKLYYIRLMNYGFRYRLAFKEERFVSGLVYAQRTANRIRYALDNAQKSPFLKLTAAIYLFSTGYGREHYWYLRPYFMLIPEGNQSLGLRYLHELARSDNEVLATEARYVLARIYMDILNRYDKALELLETLTKQYPHNLFYLALYIQSKEKLNMEFTADAQRYVVGFRQTEFLLPAQRNYYADWRNIE